MSQLTEQYFRETGERALYRMASSDYHTLRYVNWLEAMVKKFTSTNNASAPCPKCAELQKRLETVSSYVRMVSDSARRGSRRT